MWNYATKSSEQGMFKKMERNIEYMYSIENITSQYQTFSEKVGHKENMVFSMRRKLEGRWKGREIEVDLRYCKGQDIPM